MLLNKCFSKLSHPSIAIINQHRRLFKASTPFIIMVAASLLSVKISAQNQGNANTSWRMIGNNVQNQEYIGTTNLKPLVFKTSSIERMRLTQDGRIGILTDTPLE